jgi:hypothetical protein
MVNMALRTRENKLATMAIAHVHKWENVKLCENFRTPEHCCKGVRDFSHTFTNCHNWMCEPRPFACLSSFFAALRQKSHENFASQKLHAAKFVHRESRAPRKSCAAKLVHRESCAPRKLCAAKVARRKVVHRESCAPRKRCVAKIVRRESCAPRKLCAAKIVRHEYCALRNRALRKLGAAKSCAAKIMQAVLIRRLPGLRQKSRSPGGKAFYGLCARVLKRQCLIRPTRTILCC